MRIIFMGTPDFAVASLEALLAAKYEVVAVVTATDKWGGRGGKQLLESEVKKCALTHNLPILQPEKLKNPDFLAELKAYRADLQVVVAFRMLPEIIWAMPPLGTINLHGSLLPNYRGAAPINWAIMRGETQTGVTTFFLRHEIDTGNILAQATIDIGETETFGSLYDRMKHLGANLLLETLRQLTEGNLESTRQNDENASHAPKLFLETCQLDFTKKTDELYNFVRGLSPVPTAWTTLNGLVLKVFAAEKELTPPLEPPGTVLTDNKQFLKVATADGYLRFLTVQLAGKKQLDIKAFLNGYTVSL